MGVAVPIEGVKILRGCLAGPRLLSAWQAQYSEHYPSHIRRIIVIHPFSSHLSLNLSSHYLYLILRLHTLDICKTHHVGLSGPVSSLERHLAQVAWSLNVLSLSQCTTLRLAPWTRGKSNRG